MKRYISILFRCLYMYLLFVYAIRRFILRCIIIQYRCLNSLLFLSFQKVSCATRSHSTYIEIIISYQTRSHYHTLFHNLILYSRFEINCICKRRLDFRISNFVLDNDYLRVFIYLPVKKIKIKLLVITSEHHNTR